MESNAVSKPKTTPKDFVLYFGAIVAMYVSAVSLIGLLFAIIDQIFPGVLAYADPYSTGVRTAIATLIVIFPVYIYLTHYLIRMEIASPEKRDLGVRKWLIYLTLFVGGATLIIDLIVLLNRFLGGTEFTTAFFLKVLSVFVVVGALFWYYLYDLRHAPGQGSTARRKAIYGSSVLVIAALVVGFWVMGSPLTQRSKQYDAQRVADLININGSIVNYWQVNKALPKTLKDAENTAVGYQFPVDPVSGKDYTYNVKSDLSYELCATFELSNVGQTGRAITAPVAPAATPESWEHPAGNYCYERTINPNVTAPYQKTVPVSMR